MFNKQLTTLSPLLKRAISSGAATARLDGKIAIVTASTDGIGLAIAKRLAADGAKVMISSRKSKNVERALDDVYKSGISKDRLKGMVCHVGNAEDRTKLINRTITEFGAVDILVSNAAVNPHVGPTLDCSESSWDKIFEINVKAPFLLTKEIQPHFIKRKGGSVVFVSSIVAFHLLHQLGPYSVSKTALLGLTKVLAQEQASDNIRVNCVCPGVIETRFGGVLIQNPEEQVNKKILETIPMGRVGQPHEIAGIVSFLSSADASFLTGENIVVAGGCASHL